ncbi:glutathione S-transferase N-terminal domain-containing protein [Ferrimonas lipolytica]|uniref:Glutathione S-transferase n=1 Tax=Ferrimonas lipolytica TaxID=2724191 RepID=A0A6H1UGC1_9GAMM|nr:glutathione S-transferase N-terminal domain-containing protein [Ferrimonas lipolytica]QIZ77650.1 glutathione S-transferase [Ferrimonas lipolytica]
MPLPILYSLRRCPYCVRARLVLLHAEQPVEIRDIVLANKPTELITASAKGTVPVLQLPDGRVIEESLDIMVWALAQQDPSDLLRQQQPLVKQQMQQLIQYADREFVPILESYQAAVRYRAPNHQYYRQRTLSFMRQLEQRLRQHSHLFGETPSLVDYALLPFIRKFSRIERRWFISEDFGEIRRWLAQHYQHRLYNQAMQSFPRWHQGKVPTVLGN